MSMSMSTPTAVSSSLLRPPPLSLLSFRPISSNYLIIIFPILSPPISITNAKNRQIEPISNVTIEEEDEEYYDDEDEDGNGELLPALEERRRWEQNKPAGFGEGNAYDTSLEDKLLEEMEKERMGNIAASKQKEEEERKKEKKAALKVALPRGCAVRLGNLPKKKNIHRDLQAAFKGFRGIVNISPAVMGNLKTRDPICKGYAFVEFTSEEAAASMETKAEHGDEGRC